MTMGKIPTEIFNFVKGCVNDFTVELTNMEAVYNSKILSHPIGGSGFCTKIETKAVAHQDGGEGRVIIEFGVSDGEYSVPCIAHNAEEAYLSGPLSEEELTEFLSVLTESQKKGKRVEVSGRFVNHGRKRVFVCNHVEIDGGFKVSQLTLQQFAKFKKLCHKYNKLDPRDISGIGTTSPLALMMRDDTLWAELYAQDFLKTAVLLFCLSPLRKQDMIHIGIVSSHGEGKDHLVERVVQQLVPCRLAGSGKMATIPGLFGAMSGDDLNAIEIGLLPKMNHERVAISEFQTWHQDTFGELMNMMANGKIEMQKGALDVQRETTLNLLFLGNPPAYYEYKENEDGKNNKREMLDAFGKYTFQIISRLTLIFTQLSLSGPEAQQHIRNAIVSSLDGDYDGTDKEDELNIWRVFFREYLRYVSQMRPKLRDKIQQITADYDVFENTDNFQDAFCIREVTDNRKYQEYANLVRAFARLQGDDIIKDEHLVCANLIFKKSLETLTKEFPLGFMSAGVDKKIITLYEKLKKKGTWFDSITDIMRAVKGLTHDKVEILIRVGAIQTIGNETDGDGRESEPIGYQLKTDWEMGGGESDE